jgi:hypothetical protein
MMNVDTKKDQIINNWLCVYCWCQQKKFDGEVLVKLWTVLVYCNHITGTVRMVDLQNPTRHS